MIGRQDEVELESEVIKLPPLKIYNQTRLINKVNQYLAEMKRPLWNPRGYCHGLAVVWHQKMADNREQKFYDVIKKIILQPVGKLKELDDEVDVQKFIAQVEYAQNPDVRLWKQIRQIDVDITMEHRVKFIEQVVFN